MNAFRCGRLQFVGALLVCMAALGACSRSTREPHTTALTTSTLDNLPMTLEELVNEIRSAVEAGKDERLASMMALPFTVEDDTDQVLVLTRISDLQAIVPILLQTDVGMSEDEQSLRDFVRTYELEHASMDGSEHHLGNLILVRTSAGWRISKAYADLDQIKRVMRTTE